VEQIHFTTPDRSLTAGSPYVLLIRTHFTNVKSKSISSKICHSAVFYTNPTIFWQKCRGVT